MISTMQAWLFQLVILLLVFYIAGSVQQFTDNSLLLLLTLLNVSSFAYLFITIPYQILLFWQDHQLLQRIRSFLGCIVVLALYLSESFLSAWLNGV